MSKHTPGPWRAGINGVVKAGRYNVCPTVTAGGSSKGMMDEREVIAANARLIAAAPDLLAALGSAWQWMDGQAEGQSKGGHATFDLMMLREQRDIARAAIDKATGAA